MPEGAAEEGAEIEEEPEVEEAIAAEEAIDSADLDGIEGE